MASWHFFPSRRPLRRGIVLGLASALLAWMSTRAGQGQGLEDWFHDLVISWRGPRSTEANILIIGVDEASLDELKKPSAYLSPELAVVIEHLHRQGAAAVGIDLFVPDSLRDLKEIAAPDGLGAAAPLGKAVRAAGNGVLARISGPHAQMPLVQWRLKAILDHADTDLGFVNLTEDGDQFLRRQQMLLREGDEGVPQFALALYAVSRGAELTWDQHGRPVVGGETIPVDAEGRLRINWVGPPGTFPVRSFREVLEAARSDRPEPGVRGAVVLIGVTARSQQDYHATPYANRYARWLFTEQHGLMSGVEVHAHLLATLVDRAYIHPPPAWVAPLLLVVFGVLLGVCLEGMSWFAGTLLCVLHHFAWKGVALWLFTRYHCRIHCIDMLLLGGVVWALTYAVRSELLYRMARLVMGKSVARFLLDNPSRLGAQSEEREVTVLFADIRGFTTFAEKNRSKPQRVVDLLNAYFAAVVPKLEGLGGAVATFMGDGIMVFFNAPKKQPNHKERAVRAAVVMVKEVHARQQEWEKYGFKDMRIGVGVNTGRLVLGPVGSPQRRAYTAIGDVVNVASRLESANKEKKTEVLVHETTVEYFTTQTWSSLQLHDEPLTVKAHNREELLIAYEARVPSDR